VHKEEIILAGFLAFSFENFKDVFFKILKLFFFK